MIDDINNRSESSYLIEEQRASDYFKTLEKELSAKSYLPGLLEALHGWEKQHTGKSAALEYMMKRKKQASTADYQNYIKWLERSNKWDAYLDRSISYIFMRDMGKSLKDEDTQGKIERTKVFFKNELKKKKPSLFSMAGLYRLAQKEGIEGSLIWLREKWRKVQSELPAGMNHLEAERKLMKLIAGVIMHQLDVLPDDLPASKRREALDKAVRLGYAYGITYPFIDDLLDSDVLTGAEKKQYTAFIRTTLRTGAVPDVDQWTGPNERFIRFIHKELKAGFEYIKENQPADMRKRFFQRAYVFFEAQETDRNKVLEDRTYQNEDLFIPIILKSAYSRLIVRSIIGAPFDEGFDKRTFYYGIYNQLADDFTDLYADLEAGAVTPYTYFLTHHKERDDLLNPFEMYWTVISYLLHQVYESDDNVREVLLSRAINSQKRFKERIGKDAYEELMTIIGLDGVFQERLMKLVQKASDVDFLDKLLRDQMISNHQQEEKERAAFFEKIEELRIRINVFLPLEAETADINAAPMNVPLAAAANYSLESGGKRLRPILTWFMGVEEFGLDAQEMVPVLKSLEYMHTASLIFDDLPAQDDAPFRRGRRTLHETYNTAIAELTGLFLTQQAVWEQTNLNFDAKKVLQLIQYSSGTITEMCKGQVMDLESDGKQLTLEQLELICYYKTGLAFEASLVMPAILAGKSEQEISELKTYAYHAGVAFQIKDDLLDAEGDGETLGKPAGQDVENKTSTFVTVLGLENAKIAMWEHYTLAAEILEQTPQQTNFLKHFLDYIVYRES